MQRSSKTLVYILVATFFMAIVALPDSIKQDLPLGSWIKKQKITLGLDLQGGTQLDYRIDLSGVRAKNEDDDDSNDVREQDIIEGVRNTIERRVNNLGVSEPSIYISSVGDEKHIVVELAGIKDIEEAKKVVGKTIQLEFKEQKGKDEPDDTSETMKKEAQSALREAFKAESFTEFGNSIRRGDGKISFKESQRVFKSGLEGFRYEKELPRLQPGKIHSQLVAASDYLVTPTGNLQERKMLYIVKLEKVEKEAHEVQESASFEEVTFNVTGKTPIKLTNQKNTDLPSEAVEAINKTEIGKTTDILEVETEDGRSELHVYNVLDKKGGEEDEVEASHILIAYKGAERANPEVTRSKEEATNAAKRVYDEAIADPDNFPSLATRYSDGPSASKGGSLGSFKRGVMTKAFEEKAFSMEPGEISEPVETEFGYHIIKVTDKTVDDRAVDVEVLKVGNNPTGRKKLEQELEKLNPHGVEKEEDAYYYSEISFDISPDPWKPTGLDGSNFKFATVTYNQIGSPQVAIEFDSEGARKFEDITERLVGKPMAIFVGGELISAPNVNQKIAGGQAVITGSFSLQEALQLANDLNTGAIDAPILLSGQYTISATLGESALTVSLYAGLIGLLILAICMILYYRLFGLIADIALVIYSLILLFFLHVFPIVMTLAGIAGIILSIGMAVDANILIFERTREELRAGRGYAAALSAGFDRAWTSIRDSNVSSLITCAILWFFGNSIIRGFALMLALGILVSMFTAITVTRAFLRTLEGTKISKSKLLLGSKHIS